jgi:hypothetical protein
MSASASAGVQHQHRSGLVPLAALIKEEVRTERRGGAGGSRICARDKDADAGAGVEEEARFHRPLLRYGCAAQSKKGEDFFLLRTDCPRPSTSVASPHPTFAIFAVSGISTLCI